MHNIRAWILPISILLVFTIFYVTLSLPPASNGTENTMERYKHAIYSVDGAIFRGNRIYIIYHHDELDALTISDYKPIWRFIRFDIMDFTVTDKHVYVLSLENLFILNLTGAVEKRISLQNLTGEKSSSGYIMWSYGNRAYVDLLGYVYVFNGTSMDYKTPISLPELWFRKVPFGEDTLLIYSNSSCIKFYDIHGPAILWNITTNKTHYNVHYPYLIMYTSSTVNLYRDGRLIWRRAFDMHIVGVGYSPNRIIIGMFPNSVLWSHNVIIQIYGENGVCERNFTINIGSHIVNQHGKVLFDTYSEREYILVYNCCYGLVLYSFKIPDNGTRIQPNGYGLNSMGSPVSMSVNATHLRIIYSGEEGYIIVYYPTHYNSTIYPTIYLDFSYNNRAKTGLVIVFGILITTAIVLTISAGSPLPEKRG